MAAGAAVDFSPAEALALHVKALDLLQQTLAALAPASPPPPPTGASPPLPPPPRADAAAVDGLRARFGGVLKSAEAVRARLRTESRGAKRGAPSPTVCVEELLYRHALSMGREAAVDELLGKLSSSCALYARARLLLLQLACEPEVGEADRAVLLKYIAGFEWRINDILQNPAGVTLPDGAVVAPSMVTGGAFGGASPLMELSG